MAKGEMVDVVVLSFGGAVDEVKIFRGSEERRKKAALTAMSNYLGVEIRSASDLEEYSDSGGKHEVKWFEQLLEGDRQKTRKVTKRNIYQIRDEDGEELGLILSALSPDEIDSVRDNFFSADHGSSIDDFEEYLRSYDDVAERGYVENLEFWPGASRLSHAPGN